MMVLAERRIRLLAHVFDACAGICLAQVDGDESVHHGTEIFVQVESEELSTQFQILTEKDGNAFLVVLDVLDNGGDVVHVADVRIERFQIPFRLHLALGRVARFHEARQVGREIRQGERAQHQVPGMVAVIVRNADGSEQRSVLRILTDEGTDAFPEQEERGERALIFGTYEGASHFHAGLNLVD